MQKLNFLIFIILIAFTACKSDQPQRPNPVVDPTNVDAKLEEIAKRERLEEMRKKPKSLNVPALRAQALSILNHRLKNDNQSYAIVEADTWEYQFVFNGEMSKPGEYDGVWIDFKPDATYTYGKENEIQGTGKYSYVFDRNELLMVDDGKDEKPQEWSVKNAGDVMVLVGTSTYGDNAIQMKLERVSDNIQQ